MRTNRRVYIASAIVPTILVTAGLLLLVGAPGREPPAWLRVVGTVATGLGGAMLAALLWQIRQPRLAYDAGHLLVWLRRSRPLRVPIEVVECFWLGQAPSMLPGKRQANTETASIVIRIAERAHDWQRQEVERRLGSWCEGYVTIRGTFCEPLTIELVGQLNERLAEVTRAASTAGKKP